LIVFLWAATSFLQTFFYTEPVSALYWRVPVAGAVLGLFLGLWCLLNYNEPGTPGNPGPYDALFDFSPVETTPFTKFYSRRQGSEEKVLFDKRGGEFRNAANETWKPVSEGAIVDVLFIDIDGQAIEFEADQKKPGIFNKESGEVRYLEKDGNRVLKESQVKAGNLETYHTSVLLLNFLLNLLHFGLWFVCLWLLLRFQWPHALGLSLVFWLIMTLTVLPMLFTKARDAGRASSGARETAERSAGPSRLNEFRVRQENHATAATPASQRRASALSVRSQLNDDSSLPKCPCRAVSL